MSSPRRRRVRSFAMKQLLAETPRSNRTRLAYRLKRSPFSSRGSRRGVVCSRQQLRRNGVEVWRHTDAWTSTVVLVKLKDHCDRSCSPSRNSRFRYCEIARARIFVNFVRVVQDTYPQILKSQIISSPCNEAMYYLLELVCNELTGPLHKWSPGTTCVVINGPPGHPVCAINGPQLQ